MPLFGYTQCGKTRSAIEVGKNEIKLNSFAFGPTA